jgi:hypothetical protein
VAPVIELRGDTQAQVDSLGSIGHAFKYPDGSFSFPIENERDLAAAVASVGRSKANHDDVQAYIVRRAREMKAMSAIPDNWNSDGSLG